MPIIKELGLQVINQNGGTAGRRTWPEKPTLFLKFSGASAEAVADSAERARAIARQHAGEDDDLELYSDEYYTAMKAGRRGVSLTLFIGELFKTQMLTERVMHKCIKRLLANVENPSEEEVESLCKLLTTVGNIIDTPKARAHMDVHFSRMKGLSENKNVNSRVASMLLVCLPSSFSLDRVANILCTGRY